MKTLSSPLRYLASLLVLVSLFTFSCKQENKVGETNLLYGTESKVWKTDKETSATGDKVAQTSADKKTELRFYANGNFNMTSPAQSMQGKYTFDQAGKKITLTPEGAPNSLSFDVVNLTKDEITLKAPDGSQMMLEAD
ncbi:hypothetical protein [Hymenobacter crusticola]|uniref:Lipocalin-like domain-containing protein n=1 Tax=Hymenobacter crusticola TaxID=1770526 RepID=A0A2C9ZTX0_9BACT|nr:hypothetical protein [Hymenobacter crusticola]OUJ70163.1 hypothetical protein BXP70_25265 [Hymenobacter crusticola]